MRGPRKGSDRRRARGTVQSRRRQFRLEIIGASAAPGHAGTADLVRLLDDEDDEVRGAAAIALVDT